MKAHIPGFQEKNALIIGDSLTSDILGGINAGIDTCFYNPNHYELQKEIQSTYMIHNLDEIRGLV